MKNLISTALLILILSNAKSQPIFNWKNNFGSHNQEDIKSTTMDGNGNIYILGSFSDTVDFDPTANATTLIATPGQKDLFIAVYSNAGTLNWAVQIKSTVEIIPREIHIDNWGGVVYCGSFKGTVDFDPSSGNSVNKISKGGYDAFIARLKANGTYDLVNGFATTLGGTADDMSSGFSMVNSNQQIFWAGTFRGNVIVDGFQGATDTLVSGSGKGIFIQKMNGNSGMAQYTGSIQGTNALTCDNVYTTDRQQVFITGKFNTTVNFDIDVNSPFGSGPDTIVRNLSTGSFTTHTYIASYTYPGFGFKYAKDLGANINITAIEASKFLGLNNPKYNLHMVGTFSGTNDFDPSAGTLNLTSSGLLDAFVAKYNYDGDVIYAKNFGGQFDDIPNDITLDADSNILITGSFSGSDADFNPSSSITTLNSNGLKDVFFAKYTNNGNLIFANKIGGVADDEGIRIDTYYNNIFVSGNFASNAVDFDLSSASSIGNSIGNNDAFVVQYKICEGLIDNNLDIQTIYIQSIFNNPSATYTWLNCGNNFSIVPGYTTNVFQPINVSELSNGPYAVKIEYLGCIDTTFCANAISVGITAESNKTIFAVAPNPANNNFQIKTNLGNYANTQIQIIDALGNVVQKINDIKSENQTIDVSEIPNGIYIVRLTNQKEIKQSKIVIKHN